MSVVYQLEKKGVCVFDRLEAQFRVVAYFDRYCRSRTRPLVCSELQLLGSACCVLAVQMKNPNLIDDSFYDWYAHWADGLATAAMVKETANDIYTSLSGGTWPSYTSFEMGRDDDVACLTILKHLLQKVNKDKKESRTFCTTFYVGELALQVGLIMLRSVCLQCICKSDAFLKYAGNVVAAAAFALACHTMEWPTEFWAIPLDEIVDEFNLDPDAVYRCIVDL